jgi:hypothetical protein
MSNRNPWGISPTCAEAMDAFTEHGCTKLAARSLGVDVTLLHSRLQTARERMGAKGRLRYVILWDRWRQGEGKGVPC